MDDIPISLERKGSPFVNQLREFIRIKHLAYSTEKTYVYWILSFIRFHVLKHPRVLGSKHVDSYLTHLAINRKVSPQTQAVALNSIVFLFHKFMQQDLGDLNFSRPRYKKRPPVVFTHEEASNVIACITSNKYQLMANLLYGSGLRLMECCRIRVKDIDFGMKKIQIRQGKVVLIVVQFYQSL